VPHCFGDLFIACRQTASFKAVEPLAVRFECFVAFCIEQNMANQVVSILGCGWLGKPLGGVLAGAGFRVMGSTTKSEKVPELESLGIMPFVLDVDQLSGSPLTQKFFSCDVLVISLPHGVRRGKAEEYVDQIDVVMQAAKLANTKNIILISTTSVYPNLKRFVTEEDADPANPIVQAERIALTSGIPCTVIRFAGLFGPGRDPGSISCKQAKGEWWK
jgi:nucleoside-diphosphate-sugar epimerase